MKARKASIVLLDLYGLEDNNETSSRQRKGHVSVMNKPGKILISIIPILVFVALAGGISVADEGVSALSMLELMSPWPIL
jgi:hypothetical protein